MTDFLKDRYFNDFYKGRNNFFPTPRYAKKLCAMQLAESQVWFFFKVLSVTPRFATQYEIQVKNFLVNSALCSTAGS
jgi:hypothetical protein